MDLAFPYQVVTFLDREPRAGEPVYYGEHGWYAQVALKRRFALIGTNEAALVQSLQAFFLDYPHIIIATGDLVSTERMPVRVVDIKNQKEIQSLHQQLIAHLDGVIVSRYPDREDGNYYAHITAEYDGALVIPVDNYTNREFALNNVWIVKDVGDENALAYMKIA